MDAGSQAKADVLVTMLVKSFAGLSLILINTHMSPQSAMAVWLMSQEPPASFSVDRECELKAADESKSVVRYVRHALDTQEVKQHVEEGKLPTRLAMTWDGSIGLMPTTVKPWHDCKLTHLALPCPFCAQEKIGLWLQKMAWFRPFVPTKSQQKD
jgi:DNA recombination-dependent growth factor C